LVGWTIHPLLGLNITWSKRFWVVKFWGCNIWVGVISGRTVGGHNVKAPKIYKIISGCIGNFERDTDMRFFILCFLL
jgi:hypothetical protein